MIEKLRQLCELKGTTINRVEKECGLAHGAIRHWDDHPPSVLKVKAVCDHLNIRIDDLFQEQE